MEEIDEAHQSLYFLNIRQIVPFQIGSSRYYRILRSPILRVPAYTQHFSSFLNTLPSNPIRHPHIGEFFDFDIHYNHIRTRNCLAINENILFQAFNSSIKLIEDPFTIESWNKITPSISTRSICTSLSMNNKNSFGASTTLNNGIIYSLTKDPLFRFLNVTFLNSDTINLTEATDSKVSQFIEGESIFITSSGTICFFSQDYLMYNCDILFEEEYSKAAIEFASHPRVVSYSSRNYTHVVDFRLKNTEANIISCPISGVTSLLSIDMHQIATASKEGIDLLDLRFPTKSTSKFDYHFTSSPLSLDKRTISNDEQVFDCIVAHCCEASETLFFPFNQAEFSAPIRPFDTILKSFDSLETEFLTGSITSENNAFLQFESGTVIGIEMSAEERPSRHFFSTILREEDSKQRDIFKFKPTFDKITTSKDKNKTNINWETVFPEVTTQPPPLLLPQPENEPAEDPGTNGYLIELDGALDLGDNDIPTALSMFWKNHLNVARTMTEMDS